VYVCAHVFRFKSIFSFSFFFLHMCIFECLVVVMVVVARSAVRIFHIRINLYFSLYFFDLSTTINSFLNIICVDVSSKYYLLLFLFFLFLRKKTKEKANREKKERKGE